MSSRESLGLGDGAAALACAGAYLLLAGRDLLLPGLSSDEVFDAVYGASLALGRPSLGSDWSLHLLGRDWPLRSLHSYDFCALPIYAAAASFKVWGVGAWPLRAASVAGGAVFVALAWLLARLWFGRAAALAGGLLLALNPAFVVWSRHAFHAMELPAAGFGLAALLLGEAWRRTRSGVALAAAAFLLGLSLNLTTKALAVFLALPVAAALWLPARERPSARQAFAAAAAAAAGAANWAFFQVWGAGTLGFLLAALAGATPAGADNSAFAGNILRRLRQLGAMLDATAPGAIASPSPVRDGLLPWAVAAAALGLAAACALRRDWPGRRPAGFLLTACALLLAATAFTPNSHDSQHLLALWPYPLVLLGAAAALAAERFGRAAAGRLPAAGAWAAAAVLLPLLASEGRASLGYLSELRRSGGLGPWSDAVYGLAAWLDEGRAERHTYLHMGIGSRIFVLTGGRVRGGELLPGTLRPRARAEALVVDGRARFVGWAEEREDLPARRIAAALAALARARGRRLLVEKEFPDREGRPLYRVFKTEAAPGAAAAARRKR